MPGRTDNQVKNYWNTHLCKKLGIKKQTKKVGVPLKSKPSEMEGTQNLPKNSNSESLVLDCHHKGEEIEGQRTCLNNNETYNEIYWPEAGMQFDNSFLYVDNNYFVDYPDLMKFFDEF